jgi:Eco57I restriction-modification methylase
MRSLPRDRGRTRDLRILDPACGSGHFLLYAFGLLVTIYEEAYADPDSPPSTVTAATLAADYPSLDALREAIPGLALAHNLYGVDIDARCAQIAQLALWMRAQRAYVDFGVHRNERPPIRRSNIVIAEPFAASDGVAAEFSASLDDDALRRAFVDFVKAFELAGDLGLLLRVEAHGSHPVLDGYEHDLLTPAEDRLRDALSRFAADEESRASTRRRLFVEDATHAMGLIAIADQKYDVVLMNPPFGAGSARAKKLFEQLYPRTKNDVYAAFVERGIELLAGRGRLGAITSRTGFLLSSFQKWREEILLKTAPPVVVADLGYGVLDSAMVETAAYCLEALG